MASMTGFRLSPEDRVALPLATQAKRRSRVEDQVKWLWFGASNASDSALLVLKFAYSSGNMGIVRVLYRPLTFLFDDMNEAEFSCKSLQIPELASGSVFDSVSSFCSFSLISDDFCAAFCAASLKCSSVTWR